MTELQVCTTTPEFIQVHVTDIVRGKRIHVGVTRKMMESLAWIHEHKQLVEKAHREHEIRMSHPAAKELFDQYTTYINLVHK
jgi:hypothetical protein